MIFHLFRRTPKDRTIATLYGTIVAQARAEAFYQNYGVPDTVNGRFEMVVLHAVVLLNRLDAGAAPLRALGQAIFDMFCKDMDANLREMGVGDLAVPRTMQKIGEAFYGRQQAYQAALAGTDEGALTAALARNVFGSDATPGPNVEHLASYVRDAIRSLAAQDDDALGRAQVAFPMPDKVPTPNQAPQGAV
jgi:cytochrome b pre-mRNA-processing protein 3